MTNSIKFCFSRFTAGM
ncbi:MULTISPECIES: peptide IlvX [Citrobacter]|nr:peptide IlvX [Citrobacter koseri]